MRIGELSKRTGVSPRLLRYYEEQGLIGAERSPNGYRDYDERYVDRVHQVRGLLESGLSTRIIKQLLPCLDQPDAIYVSNPTPETIAVLERECERMDERIRCMVRNRAAITDYLARVRPGGDAPAEGEGPAADTDAAGGTGPAVGVVPAAVGEPDPVGEQVAVGR